MDDLTRELFIDQVLVKCSALSKSKFWTPDVRPRAWLHNFESIEERHLAACILDRFVFFSDIMVNKLLVTSFSKMFQVFRERFKSSSDAAIDLASFLRKAIFTRVEGERPSPTDSGNLFCRKARQRIGIDENQILEPNQACEYAARGFPVVFLDDFAGSGEQLRKTFTRNYRDHFPHSFAEVQQNMGLTAFYVCLIATESALFNLRLQGIRVQTYSTHIIADTYHIKKQPLPFSAIEVDSFLRKWSSQLILPDYMKQNDFSVYGFHELGLTLAFEHSVPDATLPIIWAHGHGAWIPLVGRA